MAKRAVSRAAHHDPPRHPCASTRQIQPRGLKRRSHLLRDCSIGQPSASWGAKRARSGTPGLSGRSLPRYLPCELAQIQPRGHLLRDWWSSIAQASPSWGAKRARGGTPGLPSCFLKRCSVHPLLSPSKALSGPDRCVDFPYYSWNVCFKSDPSNSWETRDWANLGDGPAGLIAELALANDVADYVRFRAVCRPWRRCSVDPRSQGSSLDSRFLPRQWIMLDKSHSGPRCRRFLNVSTGKCIRTDLPELAQHMLLTLTPEGLLLLLHEHTLVVRLLNPLTRQLTDLPPVTGLLTEEDQQAWRSGCPLEDMLRVVGAGLAGASTVAVCFRWPTALAVSRPGDENWTVADDRDIDSALACAGHFYCAIRSSVMVLDTNDLDQQPPRLRLVATAGSMPFCFFRISHSLHLVDNAGELMLVHRKLGQDTDAQGGDKYKRNYQLFRVDLEAGALVPAKDFRGRAVFMSSRRTISVSVGAFSSVSADTLYLGFDCPEKNWIDRIDGYNVADGSSEPSYHGLQPCSVVDCLSYCIRGNGVHLA